MLLEAYVNPFTRDAVAEFTVTPTVTAPALPDGVTAVIMVLLATTTSVAATPPKVTVAPAAKFIPVMVATVPPLVAPELGNTDVMMGANVPVPVAALKVAICITHGPLEVNVAL